MIIRQEQPSELDGICDLVEVTFQTAKVSNGEEKNYFRKLRTSVNYIPGLSLVAEENRKLVGHIMLTKTYVSTANGLVEALLLAPLSVILHYRNRGVGSSLVRKSLGLAKESGYLAVFVVGDPKYYGRFGFKSSAFFGVKHIPPIPDKNVMAVELSTGALTGVCGTVSFI